MYINQIKIGDMFLNKFLTVTILITSLMGYSQLNKVDSIIKSKIEKGIETKSISADGIILYSQDILPLYYQKVNFQQSWVDQENIDELLEVLNDSYNEGLTPSDYHLNRITNLMSSTSGNNTPEIYANLDLILTDAAILYAVHLIAGKVDQSDIREGWDIPKISIPSESKGYLEEALTNKQIKHMMNELMPNHFMYTHLRNGLSNYRSIAENGGWPEIPVGQVLKLGILDDRNTVVRKYLQITGDYQIEEDSIGSNLFDERLEDAVKRFQYRHNLNQDGVIGKGTLSLMNVPIEKRIEEIRINLERARWIIHHLPSEFLVVNIAGFNIRRIINDSVVFYSRVIVGKHYHESPIFDGKMTYIELNPTWTLPYSIATKETLPKLRKNPNYLAEKNMIIMDRDGRELNPSTIDFDSLSRRNFPYILRQKAGPHNALGEVKFMFPNKYSIYLHDTPGRSLFKREDRAFSHGCIRLDKKWELFLNLMGDDWNMEKINEIVKSEKTTRVKLLNPIEIILLYWTAGADKQDELYFNKDVYDRDSDVLEQLDKPTVFKKSVAL